MKAFPNGMLSLFPVRTASIPVRTAIWVPVRTASVTDFDHYSYLPLKFNYSRWVTWKCFQWNSFYWEIKAFPNGKRAFVPGENSEHSLVRIAQCSRWEQRAFPVRTASVPGENRQCSRWEQAVFPVRTASVPGENRQCSRWEQRVFPVRTGSVPGE